MHIDAHERVIAKSALETKQLQGCFYTPRGSAYLRLVFAGIRIGVKVQIFKISNKYQYFLTAPKNSNMSFFCYKNMAELQELEI